MEMDIFMAPRTAHSPIAGTCLLGRLNVQSNMQRAPRPQGKAKADAITSNRAHLNDSREKDGGR
jgi:hypothetical protein